MKEGVCNNACICVGTVGQPFLQNPIDGCLRKLVGMRYSGHCTCIHAFRQTPSRGGSRAGKKRPKRGPLFKKLLLQTGRHCHISLFLCNFYRPLWDKVINRHLFCINSSCVSDRMLI